ncbi:esterase/lipase family protein [Frateuria sp. YIM B11624]|uniref:esterase/lipase family protein n=1 Tax=Frateuria sp. YIM B11624 TaxID=3143185 RepID=UPI003C733C21
MPDQIILLHGLWMRGFALGLLHKRMADAGFAVDRFDYMSVVSSQERIVERLHRRMQRFAPGPVHLVGHSLGGLLALQACREAAELPPGRIVCLGSPVKGSAAARGFAGFGQGGEALLGHNRELLENGMERWEGAREAGMIAGRVPIGLGAMLTHMEGEHDGTVAVAETQLPGLADHCVVETSHTGLLLSADAARQAVHFLRHGRFAPALDEPLQE